MDFKELKNLSDTELSAEIAKLSGELEGLRMKARLGQVKTVHQISALRKTIARIKTLQSDRKLLTPSV
jgi:large subunit ribosomal protein L29